MSLKFRYLEYTDEITEDVYNEVIEVLEGNGITSYDQLTKYDNFIYYGFLKIYASVYVCDRVMYRGLTETTVKEILAHKKEK